ncbi:MAG: 3-oxoadipate enol-lactonase [Betaproteobacteria bacterium]|nr:MAG: 3-oxoadipate enol-lactonase [Betaproteobacteria bacterium]
MKAKTNGVELNYEVYGEQGSWVVLSHSLACHLHMWDAQIDMLKDRFRVLAYDTRGHGKSDAPSGGYTLDQLVQDARGLLSGLGIEKAHWVGLSMGGMIGMEYALRHPGEFRSLVLCDTTSRMPTEMAPAWAERIKIANEQGMAALVMPTLERWFTEPFRKSRKDVTDGVADMIVSTSVTGYVGCCHAIPKINCTDQLHKIECPVQIMVGEQDAGTPVVMSEAILGAIPGSELVVIPQASHLSNLEQPGKFNEALSRFLSVH